MELNNEFRVGVPPAVAWSVLTDVERIAPCMPGAQLQEVEGDEFRGVVKVKVGPITAQYKGKATFLERDEAAGRLVLRAEGRDTRGQGNANANITASLQPDGDGTKVTVVTDLTVTGKVAQFGRGVLAEVSAKLLNQFVDCLERDVLAAGAGKVDEAAGARVGVEAAGETVGRGPAAATGAEPGPGAAPTLPAETEPAGAAGAQPAPAPVGVAATAAESGAAAEGAAGDNGSGPEGRSGSQVRRIDHPEATPVDLLDAAGASVARRALPVLAGLVVVLLVVVRWRRRAAGRRGR